jgi:hypothetical protein
LNNTILKEQQKEIWQTHANKRSLKTKRIDASLKKSEAKIKVVVKKHRF